jgi:hypothetical protein
MGRDVLQMNTLGNDPGSDPCGGQGDSLINAGSITLPDLDERMEAAGGAALNFFCSAALTDGLTQLYATEAALCRAALFFQWQLGGSGNRLRNGAGVSEMEAIKDFVSRVLQPGVRLVQLTGCLAGQQTELVAVGHMRKCPKYKIRTHCHILLHERLKFRPAVVESAADAAGSQ